MVSLSPPPAGLAASEGEELAARRRWRPDRRWLLGAVLLAVPLVVLALGAWNYRWMSDDGFINLRIVSQIKAGNGPVFNAGERVEASTSPLWIAALLVGDLVAPLRLEYVAVLGGLASTLGGVALALTGAIRLQRGITPHALWIPVGALVFSALPPVWRFTTSGLENGLTYAWLGACFLALAVWSAGDGRLGWAQALLLGLGPLVRPELGVLSVVFLAVVLAAQWRADRWRDRMVVLGGALALPVVYEVFRMGYYGSLVPNSAIAKEASQSYWYFGRVYLRQTVVDGYWLWLPLLILLLAAYLPSFLRLRRERAARPLLVAGAFLAGGLVLALYIVRVGGDFMHARLLLPALFTVLAPVAVVPATRRFAGALLVVPWALLTIAVLRFPGEDDPVFGIEDRNAITVEAVVGPDFDARFAEPGVYVEHVPMPGTPKFDRRLTAFYGVGATSYRLGPDVYVLDLLGLGDAFTAHLELERRTIVAHEKPLPSPWINARLFERGSEPAEADYPGPFFLIMRIDDPGDQTYAERVADARRALRCPRIREFIDTYRAPLGVDRFVSNLGAAFRNFTFRIPPEPRDALRELCR